MNEQKKSSGAAKKKQPIRLYPGWQRGIGQIAGHAALMLGVAIVLGVLFGGASALKSAWMRYALSTVILALISGLFANDGLAAGTRDASVSRRLRRMEKDGYDITSDMPQAWHPMKAAAALLLVFAIPMLLSLYVAMTAEPYHYVLQDLPTWVTGDLAARSDVIGPLSYYAKEAAGPDTHTWLRMIVRLVQMPFVGYAGDPLRSAYLLDRLAPLFMLLYPIVYFVGYLFGVKREEKMAAMERRAIRVAAKRAGRTSLAEQLTQGGGEVHYGGRAEKKEDEHRLL